MSEVSAAWGLLAVALVGGLAAAGVLLGRRRRAAQPQDHAEVMRAARVAARQIARDRRRTQRGTLRGKGGGGDTSLSHDAAYGSDGGTPSGI
ncbi:hypothetical protein ACIQH6_01360 [Micromonospora orduensis]|uniref:hypothetical protein n=1 Tax=Micromonospora orduensis TaxID=1420891 RepID=UPI003805D3C5